MFVRLLCGLCVLVSLRLAAAEDTNAVVMPPASSPFLEAYRAALIAYKNSDYKLARAEAAKAEKIKTNDAKLKLLTGRIAVEFGEFAKAEKLVQEGINADPSYVYAYQYLGDVYFRQHQFVPAIDAYTQFLKLKPKDADGTLKLVYCHVARNDLSEAGKYLLQLDQFSDNHPGFYFAKAAIAQASQKKEEAEKDLSTARTIYGNDQFAVYMKTYLLLYPQTKF